MLCNKKKCLNPEMTGQNDWQGKSLTGQNDRQDESLTGQVHDQAGHCPLIGCYFQP